ncbi:MAG: hypothetical protein OIF57_04095 [Marinobacterium sp.]|nr:hypothetical protein [Marinobacterium sp.]
MSISNVPGRMIFLSGNTLNLNNSSPPRERSYNSGKTAFPASLDEVVNKSAPPEELYESLMKGKWAERRGELDATIFLLQFEVSYQAAKELDLPGNEVFLLHNNWDNYQNGGEIVDYYGNPHSRSDDIKAWLDSRPDQIKEIAGLMEKQSGMEDFDRWLKHSGNSWNTQRGRSPAGDISNHPVFQEMDKQLEQYAELRKKAQQRSSDAKQVLGRNYGPQIT